MSPDAWLGIAGVAVASAIGGVIGWGRFKPVRVPVKGRWGGTVRVCTLDPLIPVWMLAFEIAWWRSLGWDVALETDPARANAIITPWNQPGEFADYHGRTRLVWVTTEEAGDLAAAEAQVNPAYPHLLREALRHEMAHVVGLGHPKNPPSGHPLNEARPGMRDTRGMSPPRP